ncbi:ECF transporter S component [Streptomyces alkaliphilus]
MTAPGAVGTGSSPGPAAPGRARPAVRPLRWSPRSMTALLLVSAVGVAGFGWPLMASESFGAAYGAHAPWLFALILPLLLAVLLAAITEHGAGAKAVAMLGVLAAAGSALRLLGAGTAGLQPMFFLMVLAGRVLGPAFGFVLGAVTMFASALVTGGVGPWLPFQMLALGWFTLGAGLLPAADRLRGGGEVLVLAGYGALASLFYGLVMNLQGWPWIAGMASGISFVPGDPLVENLHRYLTYVLATSLGWDVPRAVLTAVLVLVAGGPVLRALRRATRRAAFGAPARFDPSEPGGADRPRRTARTNPADGSNGSGKPAGSGVSDCPSPGCGP